LKSTKGGTSLFLINGIEASDMQIRSIQPANVVKVEYYDIRQQDGQTEQTLW